VTNSGSRSGSGSKSDCWWKCGSGSRCRSGTGIGRDCVAGSRWYCGCCSVTNARSNGGYSFCVGSGSGYWCSYGTDYGWSDPQVHFEQLTRPPERAASSTVRPPGRGLSTS
jgi:hypothetical protein